MMLAKRRSHLLPIHWFVIVLITGPVMLWGSGPTLGMPFVKVYDPVQSDTKVWKSEQGANLALYSFEGVATIKGKLSKPAGAVYRNLVVDLDRYPLLQIDVRSVTKQWYLALAGKQFQGDLIKLIQSSKTGFFEFDVASLTGLSGRQEFELKLGLQDPSGGSLSEESLSIDEVVFTGRDPGRNPSPPLPSPYGKVSQLLSEKTDALHLLKPDGSDVDEWQESVHHGPLEVRFEVQSGLAIVKGKINQRNWGAAHRQADVDLSKFPILEINVVDCSQQWYLILASPQLPDGYVRLTETSSKGTFQFNVPALTKLSGLQSFDVQVGVSFPQNDSIKGEWVIFDLLRFSKREDAKSK